MNNPFDERAEKSFNEIFGKSESIKFNEKLKEASCEYQWLHNIPLPAGATSSQCLSCGFENKLILGE